MAIHHKTVEECVEAIFKDRGPHLRIATPLGLGKPNVLLNALYDRVKRDPQSSLNIFTGLSLQIPEGEQDLQRRFTRRFKERWLGENYPELSYLKDLRENLVPSNIQISEFYFQAGVFLKSTSAQQNYISVNYTHVPKVIADAGIDAILQLVASDGRGGYSLSCNPDLTREVIERCARTGKKPLVIGVVHPDLPFFADDAFMSESEFDFILESPAHQLFALPRAPVDDADYLIGLHASRWIEDGGTLQIGIGSLSDALIYSTLLRHKDNSTYQKVVSPFAPHPTALETFEKGLYGLSELITDGFWHLYQAGILKRKIRERDGRERILHGAFFLGSRGFYNWLKNLSEEEKSVMHMTSVTNVNDLYDPDQNSLRRQRVKARFFNSCLQVSALGEAVSDTISDGRVVSGIGGQYNFVAMSFELEASRSLLMFRSHRSENKKPLSNVLWSAGRVSIPRHLRDVFITEYGSADVRGLSDEETIQKMILITDARFQEDLIVQAQKAKKLTSAYRLPPQAKNNTPEAIKALLEPFRQQNLFPDFPFGHDFTTTEFQIVKALLKLKAQGPAALAKTFLKGLGAASTDEKEALSYLGLSAPRSLKEKVTATLVRAALRTDLPR